MVWLKKNITNLTKKAHSFNICAYVKNNGKSFRLKLLNQLGPNCHGKNNEKSSGMFETVWSVGNTLSWNGPWMVSFQNCISWTRGSSNMAAISGYSFNIGPYQKTTTNLLECFKLLSQFGPHSWTGPWMVPFQNCIRWIRGQVKMAAISGHSVNIGPFRKNNEKLGANFCGIILG